MTDVSLLRMASIIIISALLIVPCRLAFKIPVNLNFSGFDSFVECLVLIPIVEMFQSLG